MRTYGLLALALTFAGCAPPPAIPISVTASQRLQPLTLDNGLVVVLDPDPTATSVLVHVRYHAGAKDDPVGRSGVAHLTEHLTFEAPAATGELDRMSMLRRVGAVDISAETRLDFTDYHATVAPSLLEHALWVEASRMAHATDGLDDDAVRKEVAVLENERRTAISSTAYVIADELLAEALFGAEHPYGRGARASRGELATVTLGDVRAFALRHYQPSNATVVVSGRFDPAQAASLVSRYFARIPSRPQPPREVLPIPRLASDAFATFAAPIRSRVIAVGWVFPPPETDGFDEITLARSTIAARARDFLLGGDGLADDVRVYDREGHLGSMLVVLAKLRPGVSGERAASSITQAVSHVGTLGRTYEWDRFGEVRLAAATAAVVDLEHPARRASSIQRDLEYAGVLRTTAEDVARIQGLRAWNVGGAVNQLVAAAHHASIVIEPDPQAPEGGVRR